MDRRSSISRIGGIQYQVGCTQGACGQHAPKLPRSVLKLAEATSLEDTGCTASLFPHSLPGAHWKWSQFVSWQSFTWLSEVWWHNALQWGPSPAKECGQTWNGLNKDQDQVIKILFLRATSSFSLQYSVIKATTWGRDRCFGQKLRKGWERNILHCTALQYISHLLVMKFCKGKIICSRNPHIRAEDPGQVHFFWTL